MQTFEAVCSTLDDIADIMGSCKIYEKMHWFSQLESAKAVVLQIPKLYASCLRFMADAINYFNTAALGESPRVFFLNSFNFAWFWVLRWSSS